MDIKACFLKNSDAICSTNKIPSWKVKNTKVIWIQQNKIEGRGYAFFGSCQLFRSEFCKKSRRQQSSLWILLGWFHSHLVFQSEFFNNSRKKLRQNSWSRRLRLKVEDGKSLYMTLTSHNNYWWKNNRWPRNYSGILREFWTEIKPTSPYIVQ